MNYAGKQIRTSPSAGFIYRRLRENMFWSRPKKKKQRNSGQLLSALKNFLLLQSEYSQLGRIRFLEQHILFLPQSINCWQIANRKSKIAKRWRGISQRQKIEVRRKESQRGKTRQ